MLRITRRPQLDDSHLPETLPPLLRQIYARRGVTGAHELVTELKGLLNPATLSGAPEGAAMLADALAAQKRILIVGDFDADGATSSALCMLALRAFGGRHLDFLVPNRFDFGYGLSPELVEVAAERGAEVLITVDNGISAHAGVDAAKAAGMTVIVTDHHLPGETLPDADVIINPNRDACPFASKSMAGVGVAFYLMLALRGELRRRQWFAQQGLNEPNMAELLDVVALGTVADVVPLDPNNRLLVHQGLQRIRAGRCRPGIRALLEVSNREPSRLVASDLGFTVGPRLNAAGRLDDMALGIECLLTDNMMEARLIASQLDALNRERREIEQGMQEEAIRVLERLDLGKDLPWGVALYQSDWHQGVIGILASRIKERYHRPVIAFADAGGGEVKGSARSIPGLHMRDLLERIDTQHPGLILKFGGHAMAAGLSLKEQDYPRFAELYDAEVRVQLDEAALTGELLSDGELTAADLCLDTARMLREAGPWGQGFAEPMFDGRFRILDQRLVGQKHLKLALETECGGRQLDAIAFNVDLGTWPNGAIQWVELVYKLDINHWQGRDSVQLLVEHLKPA
ncbi:exonuclease RecJ [Ferrimonas balearica DSM 9799]|uniref:Single-stranded-DNA-specific exonuclease RecJ n=1 Tax=Ferrimonas balearica (strain DSM 9799 / CCM 4581 / KCTC 23876 / PAT) TaxID=550540 RepID=E1SUF6_FERBD|nr:single-stranded-DNA-specific exonuclease RecJ [Ferrimonas balearica]ADN77263.1 exonuclease RecJ [Ferrimonas balearica DSM 9799]MBY6107151.1 single-stranded-DNA-specific exonuclease RecJ [Ferrimonas balearica]